MSELHSVRTELHPALVDPSARRRLIDQALDVFNAAVEEHIRRGDDEDTVAGEGEWLAREIAQIKATTRICGCGRCMR